MFIQESVNVLIQESNILFFLFHGFFFYIVKKFLVLLLFKINDLIASSIWFHFFRFLLHREVFEILTEPHVRLRVYVYRSLNKNLKNK